MPMMTILIYVVDEVGKFDGTMTKMLPSLYEDSRDHVKFPITVSLSQFIAIRDLSTKFYNVYLHIIYICR